MKRSLFFISILLVLPVVAIDFVHVRFAQTPEQVVARKLRDIVLPELAFTNAPLTEVVKALQEQSIWYDDPDLTEKERGVNFVVEDEAARSKPVTLDMRFMSLHDLLKFVLIQVNTLYYITGSVIVITNKEAPFATRSYHVSPNMLAELMKFKGDAEKLLSISEAKSGLALLGADFQMTPMLWSHGNSVTLPFSVAMNFTSGKGSGFTYSLSSSIVINNGYARIFWISLPPGTTPEGSLIAMVLSARRVDDHGEVVEFEYENKRISTKEEQ